MATTQLAPALFHRTQADGPSYWGPGDVYTFLVTGEETDGAYFVMEAIVPPGGGPPPHIHTNEDETFYVLEGTPTFRLGDDTIVAGPGDFVNVPKGTPHCFHNASDAPVRMILTFTPAGIEHFFQETLEEGATPGDVETVAARYAEAAPRYGLGFVV